MLHDKCIALWGVGWGVILPLSCTLFKTQMRWDEVLTVVLKKTSVFVQITHSCIAFWLCSLCMFFCALKVKSCKFDPLSFVMCLSVSGQPVHATISLRVIASEWISLKSNWQVLLKFITRLCPVCIKQAMWFSRLNRREWTCYILTFLHSFFLFFLPSSFFLPKNA